LSACVEFILIQTCSPISSPIRSSDEKSWADIEQADITAACQMHVDDLFLLALDLLDLLKLFRKNVEYEDPELIGAEKKKVVGLEMAHNRQKGEITQGQMSYVSIESLPELKRSCKLEKVDFEKPEEKEVDMRLERIFCSLLGMLGWLCKTRFDLSFAFSQLSC